MLVFNYGFPQTNVKMYNFNKFSIFTEFKCN